MEVRLKITFTVLSGFVNKQPLFILDGMSRSVNIYWEVSKPEFENIYIAKLLGFNLRLGKGQF
jgi:hypothetical protein